MSVISGYNCSQEEAAICEACSQAIDDSYVIKLLNETMGPQTVSTLYINNHLRGIITQLSGIYFIRIIDIYVQFTHVENDLIKYLALFG